MLDLNYPPFVAPRHLANRRTQTIGLGLHNMHIDFFAPLLSGIESVLSVGPNTIYWVSLINLQYQVMANPHWLAQHRWHAGFCRQSLRRSPGTAMPREVSPGFDPPKPIFFEASTKPSRLPFCLSSMTARLSFHRINHLIYLLLNNFT